MQRSLAGNLHHQPRRNADGNEEGEQHGRRGIRRDRCHVRPHQSGHEHHRQQGRDHGQRGDDGRVADFGDRVDGGAHAGASVLHGPVAGDVFDDDDGIVHENADREDQREQGDAVDRVAHHQRREERQQDRCRDHDQRHQRFAPANRKGNQDHDGDRGQAQVEQEFIGLVVRRLAIVAGDFDAHAFRDQAAFQQVHPVQDGFGHVHGIGAGALGEGQRHGRAIAAKPSPSARRSSVQTRESLSSPDTRIVATSER